MASASLLIIIIVSTTIAAVVGVTLEHTLSGLALTISAGFCGVIAAAFVRNLIFAQFTRPGRRSSAIPGAIVVFSAVASLAGSMTAQEITKEIVELRPSLVCGLAGLISSALMGMLVAAHHLSPQTRGRA